MIQAKQKTTIQVQTPATLGRWGSAHLCFELSYAIKNNMWTPTAAHLL